MTAWVIDAQFHLASAARSVGVGLATAAWVSVLSAHVEVPSDARTYAGIGASLLATALAQFLSGRPPSMDVVELLRLHERDILAVARELSPPGDPQTARRLAATIASRAAGALERNARVPSDRRAWFRALARETRQA